MPLDLSADADDAWAAVERSLLRLLRRERADMVVGLGWLAWRLLLSNLYSFSGFPAQTTQKKNWPLFALVDGAFQGPGRNKGFTHEWGRGLTELPMYLLELQRGCKGFLILGGATDVRR